MKRVYLLGANIANSKSPALHNAAYRAMGLPWRYDLYGLKGGNDIDLSASEIRFTKAQVSSDERLRDVLWELYFSGAIGCNLTAPFKEQAFRILSTGGEDKVQFCLSTHAKRLGSVNTIRFQNGIWQGYSTDGPGWLRAFQEYFHTSLRDRNVILLGSGGAARAILGELLQQQVHSVSVVNRTPQRSAQMVHSLDRSKICHIKGTKWQDKLPPNCIVIQSTSCRSEAQLQTIWQWPGIVPKDVLACDLLYGIPPSAFVAQSRQHGLDCMDGTLMLLYQAALAIQIWTGTTPPLDIMRLALAQTISNS